MYDKIQRTEVCDGKYTHVFDEQTGRQYVERYGEKWRDLAGDGFILALCQRIWELEKRPGYADDT